MPGAGLMLIAYMAFKQPNKIRMAYLIPKDKAAWLEYLVVLAKKKTVVKYLSDKELRKVILRARPSLIRKKYNYVKDPDAPQSMYWNDKQVADWVEEMGYPHLRDAFLMNCINGRKLIEVDASALNKMGLKDFDEIKKLAFEIRELLQINRPNILRAIARKVPLKLYLQQSVRSGRTYDLLTFKKFCELNAFPYEIVVSNKCALIPCACSVLISPVHHGEHDQFKEQSSSESEGSSTDKSLADAPSVEYLVRHQVIRNRTIDSIIENLMERFWDPKYKRLYGGDADRIMQRILDEGFLELGFSDPESYTKEKVEFATGVSEELVRELLRTVEVLNDMNRLREELAEDEVRPEYYDNMRLAAENFLECALPIAANYLLGCYSLESIFKEQPEFIEFVNKITEEAERKTNERVPLAELFVDHVLSEAKLRVMAHNDFPYVPLEELRSAKMLAASVLDELMLDTSYIAHALVSEASTHHWNINDLSVESVKQLRMQRRGIKPEDIIKEQTSVSVEQSLDNPSIPEKKVSPSHPEITKGKEETESEWVELPVKQAQLSRPSTAPTGTTKQSKPEKGQLNITQQQRLPEGQQDDFNIAHVMLTPSRETKIKPRSELTAVRSRISGGPSDKHLPSHASMMSVSSKMSNFSRDLPGHHSDHRELRSKILPRLTIRLNDKDGLIYDKSDHVIGELKENGKIIMLKGKIIGHVASNGVVYSPTGGVVGKIKEDDGTESLQTRSGYRIGLGPIKEDSYFRQQNKGRPRPMTASPNFSQHKIRADGDEHHRRMTTAPASTTDRRRTTKVGLRKTSSHEDEVAELIAKWSSSHSGELSKGENKTLSATAIREQITYGKQGRPNSVPAEWIYATDSKQGLYPGRNSTDADSHQPAEERTRASHDISPTGRGVGNVGDDETTELETRGGHRIGPGSINKARPRPATASPNYSQHNLRAGQRRLTTEPAGGELRRGENGPRSATAIREQIVYDKYGNPNSVPSEWIDQPTDSKQGFYPGRKSIDHVQRPSTENKSDSLRDKIKAHEFNHKHPHQLPGRPRASHEFNHPHLLPDRPRASHEFNHPHPHHPPDRPRASLEIHQAHPHQPPDRRASHEIHQVHPHHLPDRPRASHEIHQAHPHQPPDRRASHEIHHPHPHQPPEEGPRESHPYNPWDHSKYNALVGGNQERQHLQGVHEVKKRVASTAKTLSQSIHDMAEAEVMSPSNSIGGNAPVDAIRQKKLHRREMVQRWAHDLEENARAKDVGAGLPEAEAQQRQIRMAADEIVSDVLQMALTHLLLQAEAGQDTVNVLKALKKIQLKTTSKDHDPTGKTQILWIPNIRANKNIAELTHDAVKFAAKDKVMKTLKQGVKALIKNRSANPEGSGFY